MMPSWYNINRNGLATRTALTFGSCAVKVYANRSSLENSAATGTYSKGCYIMSNKKSYQTNYLSLPRGFVGLPNETIISEHLNKLSVHSRWLYVVLLTKFNRRKDKISLYYKFQYTELRAITNYDDRRISACIRELESASLIDVIHGGKNNPSQYHPELRWLS